MNFFTNNTFVFMLKTKVQFQTRDAAPSLSLRARNLFCARVQMFNWQSSLFLLNRLIIQRKHGASGQRLHNIVYHHLINLMGDPWVQGGLFFSIKPLWRSHSTVYPR